jgi:hypothetical protein
MLTHINQIDILKVYLNTYQIENKQKITFYLDNNNIYAVNLENKEQDPFGFGFDFVEYDINIRFLIKTLKEMETLIHQELTLSSWNNNQNLSIRQLELNYSKHA